MDKDTLDKVKGFFLLATWFLFLSLIFNFLEECTR